MSEQRQHFLLSYLKTLSVGPAGVWTHDLPHGSPVLYQLSQPVGLSHKVVVVVVVVKVVVVVVVAVLLLDLQ